jgi:hypothetical protein
MQPSGQWPRRNRFWRTVPAIRSLNANKKFERAAAPPKRMKKKIGSDSPSPAAHRRQPDQREFEEDLTAEEGRHGMLW